MKRSYEAGEMRPPGLSVSPRLESRGSALRKTIPANELQKLLRKVGAKRKFARRRVGMDMTWVTDRIAVGGGIWTADNMAAVARAGVTHIIDMQVEFDDTALATPHGIDVLWNPTDDDFEPKPPELFERGVKFALAALDEPGTKLFIHCAA